MILLFGGTGETASIASALADAKYKVIVSTATDNHLDVGDNKNITRRIGRLDAAGIASLAKEHSIKGIVDASHPFASQLRENGRKAAVEISLPYVTFLRPCEEYDYDLLSYAEDHEDAARKAFSFGKPVMLTTGSRNLAVYVEKAKRKSMLVVARVLPHPESIEACRAAGLPEEWIITGRGPFSVDENLLIIKRFGIGAVVTKDSGSAGGVPEKVEAARIENCRVVAVKRPEQKSRDAYGNIPDLVSAISSAINADKDD
ncbi:MAG: precorrin-6A reductase [bacterium]|nr:MAG: precorrin-6A reductase [bacterium]